jgi:hypothetical protein
MIRQGITNMTMAVNILLSADIIVRTTDAGVAL